MNILPKKSWHVRNKDNVARVRRDEARAREEERERERRALLAETEARTELLRSRARRQQALPEPEAAGPVDLFRELLEGKGAVSSGNKDHEEELRQEKERQEKALGILTYLGQSAAEAQTQPPWYQLPPGHRTPPAGPALDEKVKSHLDPLREMQKQLGRKRRHSGDQDALSSKGRKERPPGPPSLAQLRAERLRREAAERARAEALLARVRGQVPQGPAEDQEELDERRRQYNSQYHPQLARRARGQAPQPTPF